MIKNKPQRLIISDIKHILRGLEILANIMNKEQIMNVQSLLFSLEQDATRLRLYYRQLTENLNPLNDKTFKWINESNYNFLTYVSNGNLVGQFIKSSLTEAYSSHYFNIIPINKRFFVLAASPFK